MQKFESNEDAIAATEAYFENLQEAYLTDRLKELAHRWFKCMVANKRLR